MGGGYGVIGPLGVLLLFIVNVYATENRAKTSWVTLLPAMESSHKRVGCTEKNIHSAETYIL